MSGVSNVCIVTDKALVPSDGRQKHVKWGVHNKKGGLANGPIFVKWGGHNKVILVEKIGFTENTPPPTHTHN